jgi:hypothetical protein
MRQSKSKSLIVGVQLGEAAINLIRPGQPLTAQFALAREDGEFAGLVERRMDWSEKVHGALKALADAMEEDMLNHLFEVQPPESSAVEPEQV